VENLNLAELTGELRILVIEFLKDYISKNLNIKDSGIKETNINTSSLFVNNLLSGDFLKKDGTSAAPFDFNFPDRSFKVGNVIIKNPVITAPLAGISDNAYRIFARFFGAALTFTEMISCYGIYYKQEKSFALARLTDYERPCALQIFGSDPEVMAEAASEVEENADIIDVNMGCPVPKILRAGSGGYLLKDESRIEKIIKRLSSTLKKPVTLKTRIGWDRESINILKVAAIAENSGASAISIHGRTVKQGFSGKADYKIIKEVKKKVKIPVMVSGDINSFSRAREVLDYTGCDGVMIGRASRGRLWLFMEILIAMAKSQQGKEANIEIAGHFDPDIGWKRKFSELYLKFVIYFKGENKGVREFRKHLSWIFKGVPGVSRIREELVSIESYYDALKFIKKIR
jgi:tRNA-dihydrouridine synthase B